MVLSDHAIKQALKNGLLTIIPLSEEHIMQSHVDLHLEERPHSKASVTLRSKSFILVRTKEKITLSKNICGFFDGRASLARRGISVHQTSLFIEPTTDNQLTLEIFNASESSFTLHGGQLIGKLILLFLTDTLRQ